MLVRRGLHDLGHQKPIQTRDVPSQNQRSETSIFLVWTMVAKEEKTFETGAVSKTQTKGETMD